MKKVACTIFSWINIRNDKIETEKYRRKKSFPQNLKFESFLEVIS